MKRMTFKAYMSDARNRLVYRYKNKQEEGYQSIFLCNLLNNGSTQYRYINKLTKMFIELFQPSHLGKYYAWYSEQDEQNNQDQFKRFNALCIFEQTCLMNGYYKEF